MIGYIRHPATYAVVEQVETYSYELPVGAYSGGTGTVSCSRVHEDCNRFILDLDGRIFVITGDEQTDAEQTVLTVADWTSWVEGAQLRNVIVTGSQSYVITYETAATLLCSTSDDISARSDIIGSYYQPKYWFGKYNGGYSVADLAADMEAANVDLAQLGLEHTYWFKSAANRWVHSISGDAPTIIRVMQSYGFKFSLTYVPVSGSERRGYIYRRLNADIEYDGKTDVIIGDDGHSKIMSETYTADIVSSVCLYYKSASALTNHAFAYRYLKADGTMSENAADQIQGTHVSISTDTVIGDTLTAAQRALIQEQFDNNTSEAKIEFVSDKKLHIGQKVKIVLSRGVLETKVSKCVLKSSDDRYYYTCGEIPVSVSERLAVYNWRYGSRLPKNAKKGQMFIQT